MDMTLASSTIRTFATEAAIQGWQVNVEAADDHQSGTVTCTRTTGRTTTVTASWQGGRHHQTVTTYWRVRSNGQPKVHWRPRLATRAVGLQVALEYLRDQMEIPDIGCLCCGQISPPAAGLTITRARLCWGCAEYRRENGRGRVPLALERPDCTHTGAWTPGVAIDVAPGQWWRYHPDTWVDAGEAEEEVLEYLADAGVRPMVAVTYYGELFEVGGPWEGIPAAAVSRYRMVELGRNGWSLVWGHDGRRMRIPIYRPARHELLQLLTGPIGPALRALRRPTS